MKRSFLFLALFASYAVADEIPDEPTPMTPAEHRFLVKKFMNMQDRIEELEKKVQTERERSGCV